MFTTGNTKSRFGRVGRLLATLVVMMGLATFISPASSMAAGPAFPPSVIMTVHVTNYQHGNSLEGAWVRATSTINPIEYMAVTDKDGIAQLKVPFGTYLVTVRLISTQDSYKQWSQYVQVGPTAASFVEARIIFNAETYPLKFAALDPVSLNMVAAAKVRIVDAKGQTMDEGVTDKFGIFSAKVPEGTFIASVAHQNYEAHQDFVQVTSAQPNFTTVALAPLGEPTLGDMQIHAVDANTGAPIKGAMLTVYNVKGKIIDQGMTDATGTYYTCLPETKYRVEIKATKYNSYSGIYWITATTLTHYKVGLVPVGGR